MQRLLKKCASTFRLELVLGALVLGACTDVNAPTASVNTMPEARRLAIPTAYTAIAGGRNHTCALKVDGTAVCWGENQNGQSSPPPGTFTKITAGTSDTCAIRSDGSAACWGFNAAAHPPPIGPFIDISGGSYVNCALRSDGSAVCWGEDSQFVTPPSGTFKTLSVGGFTVCALRLDDTAECWGENQRGQASPPPGAFTAISVGHGHACGLRSDGSIACWGDNSQGESTPPTGTFVGLRAGSDHNCAIKNDGTPVCWGDNQHGESTPPDIKFTTLGDAYYHACGIKSDGIAVCWGFNNAGQASVGPRVLPTATFTAPGSVIVGQPIPLALTNAQVPGFPGATSFTYAFDCGSGFASASSASTTSCATTTSGTRTVQGKVIDQDGDAALYSASVSVLSVPAATTQLRAEVSASTLSPDIRKAFFAKLDAALKALEKGQTAAACQSLQDFINQLKAQRGKAVPEATADAWLVTVQALRSALGC